MEDKERIEYFMSEIARLSNQVADLQDERDDLELENKNLKAPCNTGTWLKDSNVNGGKRQGGAE